MPQLESVGMLTRRVMDMSRDNVRYSFTFRNGTKMMSRYDPCTFRVVVCVCTNKGTSGRQFCQSVDRQHFTEETMLQVIQRGFERVGQLHLLSGINIPVEYRRRYPRAFA